MVEKLFSITELSDEHGVESDRRTFNFVEERVDIVNDPEDGQTITTDVLDISKAENGCLSGFVYVKAGHMDGCAVYKRRFVYFSEGAGCWLTLGE